jgi:Histidine kinase-, DNA gyrase B-, and HSP90-like ATPase
MTTKTFDPSLHTAPLAHAKQALESSRDSGFDLSASVGEIVDNSIEAHATFVRIRMVESPDETSVAKIAFADDGDGIAPEILTHVLSLGYSSRYNSRAGYGRFGMGLKLASLAQGECVEVYTRPRGDSTIYRTVLNLRAVRSDAQTNLQVEMVEAFPDEFVDLMTDPETGEEFASGTLVVWSEIDRLPTGKKAQVSFFDEEINERRDELEHFLARAYRVPVSEGRRIELDGKFIDLYDPTFLLPSPRVVRELGEDARGTVVEEQDIKIEGHTVHVAVTLAPIGVRRIKFEGGKPFKELYLTKDNPQAITMLRNKREIFYSSIPKMLPGSAKDNDLDRYIGIEVSFPAALDEYFQVRNVKRGAEPVARLRNELRDFLKRPVKAARDQIREDWDIQERTLFQAPTDEGHEHAMAAVQRAEDAMPTGRANMGATEQDIQAEILTIAEDLGVDTSAPESQPIIEELRETFEQRSITIVDGSWPGKTMFETTHLNGKSTLRINHRHPFVSQVYDVLKKAAHDGADDLDPAEVQQLLRKVDSALDMLILAYVKAESMHKDPEEAYSDLRSYWGTSTAAYVRAGLTG